MEETAARSSGYRRERLSQVPEDRQNALAALLPHPLDEDERWAQMTAADAGNLPG
jgi:hypothetical protein